MKDLHLKKRSFFLNFGIILMGIAGIIYFLIETILTPNFWLDLAHSLFALFGSIMICAAAYYKNNFHKKQGTQEEALLKL
jgi:multisubunit Na+/H+ antiporter MnhG subunit